VDDLDVGPNRYTNMPVITQARLTAGVYELDFLLDAESNTNYGIEALLMNLPPAAHRAARRKLKDPRSINAVAAVPSSGGSVRTDANGLASGTLTVASAFVPDGYAVGASASRFVNFGNGNVSSEVTDVIDSPVFEPGSIVSFSEPVALRSFAVGSQFLTSVQVLRSGSIDAAASVLLFTQGFGGGTTIETLPATPPGGQLLSWAAGDGSPRTIALRYTGASPSPRAGAAYAGLTLVGPIGASLGKPDTFVLAIAGDGDAAYAELQASLFGGRGGGFETTATPVP